MAFKIRLNEIFIIIKQFNPQIHQKIERRTSGFKNKIEF